LEWEQHTRVYKKLAGQENCFGVPDSHMILLKKLRRLELVFSGKDAAPGEFLDHFLAQKD